MAKFVIYAEIIVDSKLKGIALKDFAEALETKFPDMMLLSVTASSLKDWDKQAEEYDNVD